MTPTEIRLAIEELRSTTRPEQRTAYERALLAIAELVDQTTSSIDGYAMLKLSRETFSLIHDLRATIPHHFPPMPPAEGLP